MNQFHKTHKVNGKLSESRFPIHFSTVLALASCLFLGSCGANVQAGPIVQSQRPFVEGVDFNPAIPTPESITGHGVAALPTISGWTRLKVTMKNFQIRASLQEPSKQISSLISCQQLHGQITASTVMSFRVRTRRYMLLIIWPRRRTKPRINF